MNIDLLFTAENEAGLLCSENLFKKAAGIVFDTETGMMTVEYTDMDFMEFNVPVDPEFFEILDNCPQIHLGAIIGGKISQAYQIPFMFLDDPYRMDMMKNTPARANPLQAFEIFVKSCAKGQPVYREDLGDEDAMGCILGDAVPSALEFAPHLARRRTMEASPRAAPAPSGPSGPSGPGLGGSGSGSAAPPRNTTPPKRRDD